jgi:hypothetical protein
MLSGYPASRLALGNKNYRVRKVGVNLRASGFYDCTRAASPSECASDRTVRYTLEQDGVVGLENLEGEHRYYRISGGVIQDARGLANEIVLPDDASIAPFEREEFRGRPLAGSYTLRVRSRPELIWSALENIQINLDYEYWTPQG